MVKKIYRSGKHMGRKTNIERRNNIKGGVRIMKINNWKKCMEDRVKWKEVISKAETHKQ
jgi:hypothetical protein